MSSISAAAKNAALLGIIPNAASLHTAFPGTTGASECTGGGYARRALAYGTPSGGISLQTGAALFSVNSGQTVRWIGYWLGSTWLFAAPAGGASPKNFIVLPGDDTVYSPTHGWSNGQKVAIFNGTVPGGTSEGQVLFVRDAAANTFKLAASSGGAAIDMTTATSWGAVIAAVTEYVYPSAGTFTLENSTVVIPD
jgi:hypothetical protein